MKLVSALIATLFATATFAGEPAKKAEEVKKPVAAASAPATPKEMPKVEKPKTKAEKKEEAAKADATKSASPAPAPAPAAKDPKAEAAKK